MIATEDRIWKGYGIIGFFNQTVKDLEKLIEKGKEEFLDMSVVAFAKAKRKQHMFLTEIGTKN